MEGTTSTTGLASLWLVRHAESVGNVADAAAGRAGAARLDLDVRDPDVPLSERGEGQARALGAWLRRVEPERRPTAVLSSPFVRAATTARLAVEGAGLDLPVVLDERLRERDLGAFDGLTRSGIREAYPDEAERRERLGKFYYRGPGAESWADLALRVRQVLLEASLRRRGERLLVFSHQAVLLVVRYVVEGMTEAQLLDVDEQQRLRNCAMVRYESGGDGALRLEAHDDVGHLHDEHEDVTEEPDAQRTAG